MEITQSPKKDWNNLVALVCSAIVLLFSLVQAAILFGSLLLNIINSQIDTSENIILGMLIWYSLLSEVVIIPVFLTSLANYREKPIPRWLESNQPGIHKALFWSILVLPVCIFIGWVVAGQGALSVFILGLINILVAGIPVLWVSQVGQVGLVSGSQSRKWRIFGFSFTIMPFLIMIVEIVILIVLAGVAGLWIATLTTMNPQLRGEIIFLVNQLSQSEGDLESIFHFIRPYILQPGVLFWGLVIFSGIIPLIEELFKPIALWPLACLLYTSDAADECPAV